MRFAFFYDRDQYYTMISGSLPTTEMNMFFLVFSHFALCIFETIHIQIYINVSAATAQQVLELSKKRKEVIFKCEWWPGRRNKIF